MNKTPNPRWGLHRDAGIFLNANAPKSGIDRVLKVLRKLRRSARHGREKKQRSENDEEQTGKTLAIVANGIPFCSIAEELAVGMNRHILGSVYLWSE